MSVQFDTKELQALDRRLRKAASKTLFEGHSGRKIVEQVMREVGKKVQKQSTAEAASLPGNTPHVFGSPYVYKVTPLVRNIKGDLGRTRPPAVRVSASGKTARQIARVAARRGVSESGGSYSFDSTSTQGRQYIARRIGHFVGSGAEGTQPLKPGGRRNVYAKYGRNAWMDRAADKVTPAASKQVVGALDTILQEEVFQGRRATWYKNKLGGKIISGGDTFADIIGG